MSTNRIIAQGCYINIMKFYLAIKEETTKTTTWMKETLHKMVHNSGFHEISRTGKINMW